MALGEACTLIRRMWTEVEPFDFVGRHYRLKDVVCEPKPIQRPGPPILIGSGGEQLGLRVVAEHADIWNCPVRTAKDFRHKSHVLDGHCQAIGRDPAEIERSVQVIIGGDDLLAARRLLVELIEAGCTHLVLAPRPPHFSLAWLLEEIVDPVLDEVGAKS